jgi:hypothetical protein
MMIEQQGIVSLLLLLDRASAFHSLRISILRALAFLLQTPSGVAQLCEAIPETGLDGVGVLAQVLRSSGILELSAEVAHVLEVLLCAFQL